MTTATTARRPAATRSGGTGDTSPPISATTTAAPVTGAIGNANIAAFIRTHGPFIVSACLQAAAQAGQDRNWVDMQEYQGIASQLSHYSGLDVSVGQGNLSRAAGTTS